MKKTIKRRPLPEINLTGEFHPLLSRIYTARGITSLEDLEKTLNKLEPYHLLANIEKAVTCLVEALKLQHHIMIIGDFDADGATSTALAVSCLQKLSAAKVSYLVPNRFEYGYGLTPEIVEVAAKEKPDWLITVDNGISSFDGVAKAKEYGIRVVITDHHLPSDILPDAEAIVNPNLANDLFPSKNLAGVGVIFYVMMALRAELRRINWFEEKNIPEPNMASFLDLVALGTVADVVPLDRNNRILVHQGLGRIQGGKVRPGIRALLEVAGRKIESITASDFGFAVAPRLNAAGRLVDMRLGIECLLEEDAKLALEHARKLDELNKERQRIEQEMREQAMLSLNTLQIKEETPFGVCLFDPAWHQGISGILAARVKDLLHRPVIVFAFANDEELKGSGRSIPGLHLRDVLERMATENPGLIAKFGGHAMAVGLTMARDNFAKFAEIFDNVVRQSLSAESIENIIHSDGELTADMMTIEIAELIRQAGPWGQGYPEPLFDGQFKVISQRIMKEKHLKLILSSLDNYTQVEGVAFNTQPEKMNLKENDIVHLAYRLDINEYRGQRNLQLMIEYFDIL